MKMIKRSFGILLVAVLLLNLLGMSAFAAVMPDRLISIRTRVLESTILAGDTVTLVVNIESKPEYPNWAAGEFDVGYDNNYFSVGSYADAIITTGYAYEGTLSSYSFTEDAFPVDPLPEEITNFGWNNCIHLGLVDNTGFTSWSDASGEGGVDIFAVKVKVDEATPDGVYYLGLSYSGYDQLLTFVVDEAYGGMAYNGIDAGLEFGLSAPDTPLYDLSEAVVAITVGASDPEVSNDGVKVQWDANDSEVKLGYRGTISNLDITTTYNATTNAVEVNELSEIGVIYSKSVASPTLADVANSTAIKAICRTIYDNQDGTYSFRAVVRHAPIANTDTIYAVMYITLADGTTTYYSLPGSTTTQAAYNAGRSNGMPDFGA